MLHRSRAARAALVTPNRAAAALAALIIVLALAGCGSRPSASLTSARTPTSDGSATRTPLQGPSGTAKPSEMSSTHVTPKQTRAASRATTRTVTARPASTLHAGNPAGDASVPAAARALSTSHPDHVIGNGNPAGCTSAAVVRAVAAGGVITFRCGPNPVTITLTQSAKVVNAHPDIVLDGGGLVTLSGGGKRRILYQNTCDQAQGWTTSHCNDQDHPGLTVQNLTFADGNSSGQTTDGGGGGAIFVRGGRLKVVNSKFVRNTCERSGPDLGGAAIRALDQAGSQPVYVVASTFGGASGQGGICSNGGALSSIGVSWVIVNSLFSHNWAVGHGANPAKSGSAGGGSGGAIYTDGNAYTVSISGTLIESNHANEGGGAAFYVSNDHTGSMTITSSTLRHNPSDGFGTQGYPGIFYLGRGSHPTVVSSSLS